MKKLFILIACVIQANTSFAETSSTSRKMDFDKCIQVIDKTAKDTGVPYNVIVNTKILKMIKIITADGSVLLTCSKPDQKLTTTITQ